MSARSSLLPVIHKLFDAATHDDGWNGFLSSLAACFSADGAQIVRVHPSDSTLAFSALLGYDRYLVDRYADGNLSAANVAKARYAEDFVRLMPTDPRIALLEKYPTRPISCRLELAEPAIHNSAAYQQLLGPANVEYSLVVNLPEEDGSSIMMGVFRGKGRDHFSQADADLFGELIPFVKKTIVLSERLSRTQFAKEQALDVLNEVPLGVFILAQHQQIIHCNAAAQRILANKDGLEHTANDALMLHAKGVNDRLRSALHQLCLMGQSSNGSGYEAFSIERPSGNVSYAALITRLDRGQIKRSISRYSQPLCLLFVGDPDVGVEPPAELIRRLYGLTLGQARVCELLVSGQSLDKAAATLGITRETARSHLKKIFENVGVSRQVDLVQKVSASPLWIARRATSDRIK